MDKENSKTSVPENHHLTRYENEGKENVRSGPYWAFAKSIKDVSYSKSFWAYEYGSIEAAYLAAKQYRDDLFKTHGIIIRDKNSDVYLKKYDSKIGNKSSGTHTWLFQIRHNDSLNSKYFPDSKYGGKAESLEAAKAYRDKFIADNKIDISDRFRVSVAPGVHKTYSTDKNGDKKWYYQVAWFEGKNRAKRFSILKHGDEKALRLAKAFRKQIDRQLQNGNSTAFIIPENPSIRIWRYMDFTKFVYTLDKACLYFTHVDLLGDPYEGSYSRANTWIRKLAYSKSNETIPLEKVIETMRETRKHIFVNCWHMNEGESAAMWKLYAKTNEAICIQSSYERLKKNLPTFANIGMVNYIDYDKEWVPEDNIYNPFLFKRQSFQHEREIRAIIYSKDPCVPSDLLVDKNGLPIQLDINYLIDKIYVSPEAPDWFYKLVKNVSIKYGINKKVLKSSLDSEPMK